jgi:hypothetical protein
MSQTTDAAWWDATDDTARAREIIDEPQGFEPTAMVAPQGGQGQQSGYSGLGELAQLAGVQGPRDSARLLAEARKVGGLLGEKAFYRWRQGGSLIQGPTIDLMDALAGVWGRVVCRIEIIAEERQRVHLRGRVIDLLTLVAVERDYQAFLASAPGKFAGDPEQSERWRVMQLQSGASKAMRGALEHALPRWLIGAALDAAFQVAADEATGGLSLAEAAGKATDHLATHGLTQADLEAWVGQPRALWAVDELGSLRTLAKRLKLGEIAVDQVRAAGAAAPPKAPQQAPQQAPQDSQGDRLGSLRGSEAPQPAGDAPRVASPPVEEDGPPPATDPTPAVDPEKAAALKRIGALEAELRYSGRGGLIDTIRRRQGARRIGVRTKPEKLAALEAALQEQVSKLGAQLHVTDAAHVGSVDVDALRLEIAALEHDLGVEVVTRVREAGGVGPTPSAGVAELLRYHGLLDAEVPLG